MAKQSDLTFQINKMWEVEASFENIKFYWERFGDHVVVEGGAYDRKLYIPESNAKEARKAMVKFLGETFNV